MTILANGRLKITDAVVTCLERAIGSLAPTDRFAITALRSTGPKSGVVEFSRGYWSEIAGRGWHEYHNLSTFEIADDGARLTNTIIV